MVIYNNVTANKSKNALTVNNTSQQSVINNLLNQDKYLRYEINNIDDLPSDNYLLQLLEDNKNFLITYNDNYTDSKGFHKKPIYVSGKVNYVAGTEIIGRFDKLTSEDPKELEYPPIYKIRYIRNPKPIILEDLSQYGLSIKGESDAIECELPVEMHEEILQRAVELAKAAWEKDYNIALQQGQRSE